jgi:hypothetical protein
MLRLIQKWLNAGVSEGGQWSATKAGTPRESGFSTARKRVSVMLWSFMDTALEYDSFGGRFS